MKCAILKVNGCMKEIFRKPDFNQTVCHIAKAYFSLDFSCHNIAFFSLFLKWLAHNALKMKCKLSILYERVCKSRRLHRFTCMYNIMDCLMALVCIVASKKAKKSIELTRNNTIYIYGGKWQMLEMESCMLALCALGQQ